MQEQLEHLNDKKNILWNIIGSTVSAFSSLIFAIIVTRINGVDVAGDFTFSYAIACLFYVVGNFFGRVFQVTDISKKYSNKDYIINRLFTCSLMIVISFIFSFIKGYEINKFMLVILLCFYKTLEAFFEVLYGILQKNNELYKVRNFNGIKSNYFYSFIFYNRFFNTELFIFVFSNNNCKYCYNVSF